MRNQNPKDGWNYRVVRGNCGYSLREVHYKNGKIERWSPDFAIAWGLTITKLKDDHALIMHNALSKPVLRVTGKKLVEIKKKR